MCCGKLRQPIASEPRLNSAVQAAAVVNSRPRSAVAAPVGPSGANSGVAFEYGGATALTVVSPLTGKTYRFAHAGARLEVDPRDRSWVSFVPSLKRVEGFKKNI